MDYREHVSDEIAQVKENRNSNNNGGNAGRGFSDLDQIEVDMGETPFVKFYPTTALTGTVPTGEGNPIIRFRDEKNNGHGHQGYLGIVLDNLRIDTDEGEYPFDFSDAAIVETDDDDYTEYRAVNFNDEKTTSKYGGDAVNIDGDQYGVADKHTELDERVILVVDRTAAVSVAKKLDVAGGVPAGMDSDSPDDINSGLIEYASMATEDADPEVGWRYARSSPEMRSELLGTEVTFVVSRREETDNEPTGYIGKDGKYDEPVVGFAEDSDETHTDPSEASYLELVKADEARPMMWYSVFNEDGEPLSALSGEDAGTSTNRPYLEWTFDPTANHLPERQWEFVQTYQANDMPDDEETIVKNIRDNLGEDTDEERIVGLIQAGAGQE